jgi:arylsulfatase A-like enzyme
MNVVLHEPFCLLLGLAVALHYAAYAWSRRYSAVITRVAERLSAPRNRRAGMLALGAVSLLLAINAHALRAHERRGDAVLAMSGEYFFLNGLPRFFREEALKSYSVAAKPARAYLPPSDRVVAAPAPPRERKPNVFLITVESFNSLYTLPPGQLHPQLTEEVMPFFKSLASDGLMFTNVYTSSAYTFNGITAVLCSQYTMAESVWGADCLPQLLKRAGYETFMFVSIPQLRPYRYDNFQAMGFDRSHVFDAVRMRVGRKNVFFNPMTDKELFDYAARVADSTSRASTKPLFLHVSTDAMHVPGLAPHPGCTPYEFPSSLEVDKLTRRMLNAAHCTDYDLATYIAHLKASGLYDDALVIITADHAFNLSFWDHKETELAKIPLFVKFPKSDTAKRQVLVNRLSAQVDIAPTIIDYLGLTTNRPMYGRSLLANANAPAREMPGISNSRLMSLASPSGAALHQRGKSDVADHRVQDELDAFYETVLYFDQNPKSFEVEVKTARGAARP